jgi:DNA-binding MarR family transcriptional regulator
VSESPAGAAPVAALADRLGYLIKHAHQRLTELTTAALAPLGINGRELSVLLVIADQPPASQLQIATRMGVDRTTMVSLIDGLERAGLVERRPDPADRRRNVTALTDHGRDVTRRGAAASAEAERAFLAPLPEADRERIRAALRSLAFPDMSRSPTS